MRIRVLLPFFSLLSQKRETLIRPSGSRLVHKTGARSLFDINTKTLLANNAPVQGEIQGSDSERLIYNVYAQDSPKGCLIFMHGGGAHSRAGYTRMAEQLSMQFNIATYLFDIRGHGKSGGARGHTPMKEQVWDDLSSAITFLKQKHKKLPIYLGGHSSGAGLVLNYSCWPKRHPVDGYVMVAPEFGLFSNTARQYEKSSFKDFTKVNKAAIIAHHQSGGRLFGDSIAVQFNYSDKQIKEEGLLPNYTVNMCLAVTPADPETALRKVEKPVYILAAKEDELIDSEKLEKFVSSIIKINPEIKFHVIPDASHLLILKDAHQYIGPYLLSLHSEPDQQNSRTLFSKL